MGEVTKNVSSGLVLAQEPWTFAWWASYFVKVTELQLHGKKVTKLQLPF